MTNSLEILGLVHEALLASNTDSEDRIYKPGDWPTQNDQYPITKLRLVLEDRTSIGRGGAPQFTTVATIRFSHEVSEPAELDDAGAAGAELALWRLKRQAEIAVINSYPLMTKLSNIPSMRTQLAFNSESATHLAGAQQDISFEFYEGPESFAPIEEVDLDQVIATNPNLPPTGFQADLQP